jgi:hypothetical protein
MVRRRKFMGRLVLGTKRMIFLPIKSKFLIACKLKMILVLLWDSSLFNSKKAFLIHPKFFPIIRK